MPIICDTHIPIFYQDAPERLSALARRTFEQHIGGGRLALADISLWEMAMLFQRGRLNTQAVPSPQDYISDLITGYGLAILPIDAEIATVSQAPMFVHGDPADRLIGATAMVHQARLLTRDERLRQVPELQIIW